MEEVEVGRLGQGSTKAKIATYYRKRDHGDEKEKSIVE